MQDELEGVCCKVIISKSSKRKLVYRAQTSSFYLNIIGCVILE